MRPENIFANVAGSDQEDAVGVASELSAPFWVIDETKLSSLGAFGAAAARSLITYSAARKPPLFDTGPDTENTVMQIYCKAGFEEQPLYGPGGGREIWGKVQIRLTDI